MAEAEPTVSSSAEATHSSNHLTVTLAVSSPVVELSPAVKDAISEEKEGPGQTESSSATIAQSSNYLTVVPAFSNPVVELQSTSDAAPEEKEAPGPAESFDIASPWAHLGIKRTDSGLHGVLSRQESQCDCADKSCVFEAAYPKDTERSSIANRINDFCFSHFGLCSNPANVRIQTPAHKQSGGHGVWSSDFHSMCVKLAVYIGTTEYILGPRLAWHYGGFIFYFVVMCLVLISSYPANFLESLAGQYSAKSVVVLLTQLGPLFRGLGYAMLIITGLIMVYYSAHVAKVFMYAYHAPQVSLPWHDCSAEYNSKHCFLEELEEHCNKGYNHSVYYDFKCVPAPTYCIQNGYHEYNGSHCLRDAHTNITFRWMVDHTERRLRNVTAANASEVGSVGERFISSRDFHYHYISGRYECQKNVSLPVCENNVHAFLVAYCAVWVLALLPCFNLWVASTFAMVVIVASPLVTLLVMTRVVLFPGAWAGVSNFFFGRANLAQLLTKNFWMDACGMTLWSLSFGTGVIPTLSSRDRLRHNALRSCTILVTADVVFGLLNSILLFSVRGHLERHVGISKDQLQQLDHDSEALVFVAFTTITDGMPRPRFWGSIYFGTMAAQALATLAMIMVSLALNLVDAMPSFRSRPFWLAVLVAVAPFILCATVLAVSVFHDVRLPLYPLVRLQLSFVALLFIVVVGFKLSRPEFRDQVQVQLGIDARGVWRQMLASWLVVCPFIVLIEILGQLMVYRFPPVPPGGLPTAVFAYTAALCPLLALVVGAVYSARTTPFWELCNTSKQFGHRERRARRRTLTPAVSARSRRSSMRRGTIGVVRSLTAEDATSRRSATSEISDEMKTVLGVR